MYKNREGRAGLHLQTLPKNDASPAKNKKNPKLPVVPVVALGGSAGGLEAFEQFFLHLPVNTGSAFVVISHLSPDHESLLSDILQRSTAMDVSEAVDGMPVKANFVYIIPPNKEMTISGGVLMLTPPGEARGHRMPIDLFFSSLAKDLKEKAVGIILSGTGTDGTFGLGEILKNGGTSIVQTPSTARYDGMPTSAIQAGFASVVLPVEEMPEALAAPPSRKNSRQDESIPSAKLDELNTILKTLYQMTGHDFSQYKKNTILRRINRRMVEHGIDDSGVYARYLRENPGESSLLMKELLINVTSFFRDPAVFGLLSDKVLPELMADKPDGSTFRVWVPGGASGEEVYSIAIILREVSEKIRRGFNFQIYGTDLDDDEVTSARAAVYPESISKNVTPERLDRFFIKDNDVFRVKKEIRDMVVFAKQNIIQDPPFTKMDLLSCRNLLIYLEQDLQDRLVLMFHFALKPDGVLVLSPSESLGKNTSLFTPISRKWKIYKKLPSPSSKLAMLKNSLPRADFPDFKSSEGRLEGSKTINFAELTSRALLQSISSISVVTDRMGEILFVHGETGNYLRPGPGLPSLNIVDMAKDNFKQELGEAIHSVGALDMPTITSGIVLPSSETDLPFHFTVRPLPDPETAQTLLLISFFEMDPSETGTLTQTEHESSPGLKHRKNRDLARDLSNARANLQITMEKQQIANEEMKSTNEELQSTNEELETSKEEMQSVNEELITVNSELQGKIEQLIDIQNDMKNLLDNIHIGTIFLDEDLTIRRFSHEATKVYRLIDGDIGRPLSDIKSNLNAENLLEDARSVLNSLVPIERELVTYGNTWFLVHIHPYRTMANMIQGVVMTFTDITKRIEGEMLEKERELAEDIVNTVREPLVVLDKDLHVVSASHSFFREFRVLEDETIGHLIYDLGGRQWDVPELRKLLETILPYNLNIENYEMEAVFPNIGSRNVVLNARRINSKIPGNPLILLAIEILQSEKGTP